MNTRSKTSSSGGEKQSSQGVTAELWEVPVGLDTEEKQKQKALWCALILGVSVSGEGRSVLRRWGV